MRILPWITYGDCQTTPHAYLSRIAPLTEGTYCGVSGARHGARVRVVNHRKEHEPCLLIRRTTVRVADCFSRRFHFPVALPARTIYS